MCYLAYKPEGAAFDPTWFENAAATNPHGYGFAYFDGKWKIHKSLELKPFMQALETIPDKRAAVIHARFATHGKIHRSNCHPFKVSDYVGAHNGIIPGYGGSEMTDSEDFMRQNILSANDLRANSQSLQEQIGSSKMVFLTQRGDTILNEHLGTWDGGVWHSNKSYLDAPWGYVPIDETQAMNDLEDYILNLYSGLPRELRPEVDRLLNAIDSRRLF